MALGYCPDCDKLVTITPRETKDNGTKQRWWKPVDHDGKDGRPCPGRAI